MSGPAAPLAGKRVLDCATFIAGPTCATVLGEFGAEVIKVELPGVGCPLCRFGTMTETGMSLPWLSEARNRKSLTLDDEIRSQLLGLDAQRLGDLRARKVI